MASCPFSRPCPDILFPPKAVSIPPANHSLTKTCPEFRRGGAFRAISSRCVKTPATRPNRVPFAMSYASSSFSNLMMDRTGPKTSSWAIYIVGSTSAKTVGCMNRPPLPCSRRPPVNATAFGEIRRVRSLVISPPPSDLRQSVRSYRTSCTSRRWHLGMGCKERIEFGPNFVQSRNGAALL